LIINVKAVPNSKKPGVERIGENDFKVNVDAKAEEPTGSWWKLLQSFSMCLNHLSAL